MTSMDPTTADTIDANGIDADTANEIAGQDQDTTEGLRSVSGESEGADTDTGSMGADTAALGGGAIGGETEGAELNEDGDRRYPGD